MATRADVVRFQRAANTLSGLAQRDLARIWPRLPLNNPAVTRDALLDLVPALTATYGDPAAAVAADWYTDLRSASGAPGRHAVVLADPPPVAAVEARVRYGVGPLFAGDAAMTYRFLTGLVEELVKQPARDTIDANTASDRARPLYARVPTGAETCAFCLLLASRGAVYGSERAAELRRDGQRYHSDCDCAPTPIWPGDTLPGGYDPDALFAQYQEARAAAGWGADEKAILAELRFQQGIN